MKITGLGGFIVVGDAETGNDPIRVDNMEYSYQTRVNNDDTTDSTSTGEDQGLPCTYKVQNVEFSVADNTIDIIALAGIDELSTVSAWLRRGSQDAYDYIDNLCVGGIGVRNTQKEARKLTVSFEFGTITRNATAPTNTTTPPGY